MTTQRFFSYDPLDYEIKFHDTEGDARSEAEAVIRRYRHEAMVMGSWSKDIENVCWGEIRQRASLSVSRIGKDRYGSDVNFKLLP